MVVRLGFAGAAGFADGRAARVYGFATAAFAATAGAVVAATAACPRLSDGRSGIGVEAAVVAGGDGVLTGLAVTDPVAITDSPPNQ